MICADFLAGANLAKTQRLSLKFDYAELTEFDTSTAETTSTQTGSERIWNRPDARSPTRWLAVSRVRLLYGKLGGPSHETQPTR